MDPAKLDSEIFHDKLPFSGDNQVIGLFGGSFSPAHEGHRLVANIALRRLNLASLWVLFTPHNPFKTYLENYQKRLLKGAKLFASPRIKILGIENYLNYQTTIQTICFIKAHKPRNHFIWIMGADNLAIFHYFNHYRKISCQIPIAVINRPGYQFSPLNSHYSQEFARYCQPGASFAYRKMPSWTFIYDRLSVLASSKSG